MGSYEITRLAATTANAGQLRKIYGITCAFSGCAGDCEKLAGEYGKFEFDRCPISYLHSRRWSVVLELFAVARVSPLSDWPVGWAPWVVRSLSELTRSIETAKAEAANEAAKGARHGR